MAWAGGLRASWVPVERRRALGPAQLGLEGRQREEAAIQKSTSRGRCGPGSGDPILRDVAFPLQTAALSRGRSEALPDLYRKLG